MSEHAEKIVKLMVEAVENHPQHFPMMEVIYRQFTDLSIHGKETECDGDGHDGDK